MLAQRIHRAMWTWLQVPNISEYPGEKWSKAPVVAHILIFLIVDMVNHMKDVNKSFYRFSSVLKSVWFLESK